MSMPVSRARSLLSVSLPSATVIVWEGANRLSVCDPTKPRGRRRSSCDFMASGALLPSRFRVSPLWPFVGPWQQPSASAKDWSLGKPEW
jgi:hypothetical protein